jgi:hypothetical protein
VTDDGVVVLALTWRSYLRAAFFTSMLGLFGVGAAFFATGWMRVIGAVLGMTAVVIGTDFVVAARRWRFVAGRLYVPRAWSPDRTVQVADHWVPGLSTVGRRDTMFPAPTPDGIERIAPNLLIARSDVMQWLHLIGQARA